MNGLLRQATNLDRFSGIEIGKEISVKVSLFQFADDTIFVGEASEKKNIMVSGTLNLLWDSK